MMGESEVVKTSGPNQLNVDGDLLSGETPAWTVVDGNGDARLYVETSEDGSDIQPGGAFVEPVNGGRLIEVGMAEERETPAGFTEEVIPLVNVETGEVIEEVFEDDLKTYAGVVEVNLVS